MVRTQTRFSPSSKLRQQAEADYTVTIPLVREVIRLTNLMDNARRDVTMWTTRLESLEVAKKTNPTGDFQDKSIEVARRNMAASEAKLKELLTAGDQSITIQTVNAAKALLDQLNLISAGFYDWVAIDASREKKIAEYNQQIDELSAECRQHYKTGQSLRRAAMKALEVHNASLALSRMKGSQEELAETVCYPKIIERIQDRREQASQQYEVAMLGEWLRTMPEKLQALLNPPQLAGAVL